MGTKPSPKPGHQITKRNGRFVVSGFVGLPGGAGAVAGVAVRVGPGLVLLPTHTLTLTSSPP